MGAWTCLLGAWICLLGVWNGLLDVWNCRLGVWICLLGVWNCLLGVRSCLLGVWICLFGGIGQTNILLSCKKEPRVIGACWRPKTQFLFSSLGPLLSQKGLKATGPEGSVGLRQESVDFPDFQEIQILILVIWGLN